MRCSDSTLAKLNRGTRPVKPARRGFTLIEVMVVVVIIVTLAAISIFVAAAVKRSASKRATVTTLRTLQVLMDEYLKQGNPEPVLVGTAPLAPQPQSDTVNFVKALRATAGSSNRLQSLSFGDDGSGNKTILDAFGNPIRFVPSTEPNNTAHRFYFFSAGPDGAPYNTQPNPPNDLTADNISSLDTM